MESNKVSYHQLYPMGAVVDTKGYSVTDILEKMAKEIEYLKEPYKLYWEEKIKHKSV